MTKKDEVNVAESLLELLHTEVKGCSDGLLLIQKMIQEGKITCEDINTTEEELQELLMKGYKIDAKHHLEELRAGTHMYNGTIALIRQMLTDGNLSLEDIGTSENEIKELRIKGCKVYANTVLSLIRQANFPNNGDQAKKLRKALQEEGLSPEDVGTTQEELESFMT